MIDHNMKWCVYETRHASLPHFYRGKAQTSRVLDGTYKGSGTKLKLAFTQPATAWDTWTTTIVSTHPSEDLAYEAEAAFVPLTLLSDVNCLNLIAGGRRGRHQTLATLLRQFTAAEKREARRLKAEQRKLRTIKQREAQIKKDAKLKAALRAARAKK